MTPHNNFLFGEAFLAQWNKYFDLAEMSHLRFAVPFISCPNLCCEIIVQQRYDCVTVQKPANYKIF